MAIMRGVAAPPGGVCTDVSGLPSRRCTGDRNSTSVLIAISYTVHSSSVSPFMHDPPMFPSPPAISPDDDDDSEVGSLFTKYISPILPISASLSR